VKLPNQNASDFSRAANYQNLHFCLLLKTGIFTRTTLTRIAAPQPNQPQERRCSLADHHREGAFVPPLMIFGAIDTSPMRSLEFRVRDSIRQTLLRPDSDNRLAATHPAEPAITMKSNSRACSAIPAPSNILI
jgi:hypothetical protein